VTRSFSPFVHERVCLTIVHTHTHTHTNTHTTLRAPISFVSLLSPVKQVLSPDSRFSPKMNLGWLLLLALVYLAPSQCHRTTHASQHLLYLLLPTSLASQCRTTHIHTHTHTQSLTFFQPAPLQQALTAIRHRAWALMDTRASFTEAFRGCRWLPPTWGRRLQAAHRGATQCRT
jgi:hypothetical protein